MVSNRMQGAYHCRSATATKRAGASKRPEIFGVVKPYFSVSQRQILSNDKGLGFESQSLHSKFFQAQRNFLSNRTFHITVVTPFFCNSSTQKSYKISDPLQNKRPHVLYCIA